jgi:DNA-binding CsgD family transcriptional regulator
MTIIDAPTPRPGERPRADEYVVRPPRGNEQSGGAAFAHEREAAATIDGILLYDECHLVRTGDAPRASHAPELLAALCAARGAAEREQVVRGELQAIGADWLEYGKLQCQGDRLQPLSLLQTYSPPAWLAPYLAQRLWQADTRLRGAPFACAPILWTVAEQRYGDGDARVQAHAVRNLFDTLADTGVGSGMTICLATPNASHTTAMHFLSRRTDLRWAGRPQTAAALLLGTCLNEFISRHTVPLAANELLPGKPNMSALQARVADCVLQGLSDKEVARSLELSRHTVDYHLRALRHRFNVHNRVQLAQAIGGLQATLRA